MDEERRISLKLAGFGLTLLLALLVSALSLWIIDDDRAARREHRVELCVLAMTTEDRKTGPLPSCEALSEDERREAAYRWARRAGVF